MPNEKYYMRKKKVFCSLKKRKVIVKFDLNKELTRTLSVAWEIVEQSRNEKTKSRKDWTKSWKDQDEKKVKRQSVPDENEGERLQRKTKRWKLGKQDNLVKMNYESALIELKKFEKKEGWLCWQGKRPMNKFADKAGGRNEIKRWKSDWLNLNSILSWTTKRGKSIWCRT